MTSTKEDEPLEKKAKTDEDPAITRFREYLRIKTVHPNPDYESAVKFLERQAQEVDLPYQCLELHSGRPVVIMTWKGSNPDLPSIMLNSHMDVVPVYPEHWTSDPFAAEKMENGDIIARGSQDMKCVGMQYLEAIRCLKNTNVQPFRSVHVIFVPDEEIGGTLGMELLIKSDTFKDLNVGFALDEGLANPTEKFTVYYNERCVWWLKVKGTGNPGHGSRFIENTAAEKLIKMINKLMELRETNCQKLLSDTNLKLGDVTTINLTMLNGGIQMNVVPNELTASFDVRVAPSLEEFNWLEQTLEAWSKETGCTIEWQLKKEYSPPTCTDSSSPWWTAFSSTCDSIGIKFEVEVFPAGTDGYFLRRIGTPVLGFSPMNHTPILLHDHNEFLNERIYLNGIDIYQKLIPALAAVPQ